VPNQLQTHFGGGEVAPGLQGFVDLKAFISGLLTQENFLTDNNGGITFRQGTYYAANTAGNATGKLIPFVFNAGDTYQLEFTANRIRFYTGHGQLDVAYTVSAATWTSSVATLTFTADHCFIVGDTVTVAGISPSGYNGTFTITAKTSTTISYALASNPGSYTSGGTGTGAYQITGTVYNTAPTSWTQSNDVMYLANGTNPIQVLTRLGTTNWTLAAFSNQCGPFQEFNSTSTTLTFNGTATVTASAATFASTDVGRQIMLLDSGASYNSSSGAWRWTTITAYTDSTHVTVGTWYETVGDTSTSKTMGTTASKYWSLGAWSGTTGYPATLSFYQARLIYGGETGYPQYFGGSVTGLYTYFTPFDPDGTVNPDNAYRFQIASGRADGIKWIVSDRSLMIGTGYGEYVVKSSGPAITPTDISVEKQTNLGSAGVVPAQLSYRLMIPDRSTQFLHEWSYNWQVGGYRPQLANKFSDHILKPSITRIEYQLSPVPTLWMLRSDGQLVTAVEAPEGWAFARHILGGSYSSGDAVVEDVSIIPTSTYDEIWLIVKRTVNGSTVRFVEYLSAPFDGVQNDAFQVDAGLSYSGSATNTFTGLDHLEGETVAIWGDGAPITSATVSGGSVTTANSYSTVAIGLSYTGTAKTLQLASIQIQGKTQSISRAYVRLLNTYNGKINNGTDTYSIEESSGVYYSGSTRNVLGSSYGAEPYIKITQTSPCPMSVLNMGLDFDVGDS
jgi:hypothetical protein